MVKTNVGLKVGQLLFVVTKGVGLGVVLYTEVRRFFGSVIDSDLGLETSVVTLRSNWTSVRQLPKASWIQRVSAGSGETSSVKPNKRWSKLSRGRKSSWWRPGRTGLR